jgi:uncharacterized protein involved in type VI secretion and phage assembly
MNLTDVLTDKDEKQARTNRIYGVVSAVVTDNHDPDGRARVKLKFPWLEEQAQSDWAKIACLMAGKDRGSVFLPENGDEVLVAFEHGDVHHPYVLGALWNSEDTPPETNSDGKNNIRKIKSRSGHELIFCDDGQGQKEKVELHTKAGHKIVLDDSTGAEKIEIRDKSGSNVVTIDSVKGEMSLESQTSLKIKSLQIEIEAQTTLKLSAGALVEVKGGLVKIN